MAKEYTYPEEKPQMVSENVAVNYPSVNTDMDQIRLSRMEAFTKLILSERPSELDDSVVLAECEAARQEIYNQLKTK